MDFYEVIKEFEQKAKHIEPYTTGSIRIPSTAFCILFKLLLYRLSSVQMMELLTHRVILIFILELPCQRYRDNLFTIRLSNNDSMELAIFVCR